MLISAGSAAATAALTCKRMRSVWRSVLAQPSQAAQWIKQRYGPANALAAVTAVPLERYINLSAWANPSQAPSVSRVHILGLLVTGGCHASLSLGSAAVLLRDACLIGSPQAVQLVVRCGNPGPAAAQPALTAAAEQNHLECLRQVLLATGADPAANCSLALRLACRAGAAACVDELLAQAMATAPVTFSGSMMAALLSEAPPPGPSAGHSPQALALALAHAALGGHTSIQASLLRASQQPTALATLALIRVAGGCCAGGSNDASMAFVAEAPAAVQSLLTAGADATAYGSAALIAACQRPAAGPDSDVTAGEVVRQLIRAGADPRLHDSAALVAACRAGACFEVVTALLAGGAVAAAQESAALRLACKFGAQRVAELLLVEPYGSQHGLLGLSTAMAEAAVAGHMTLAEACAAASTCQGRGQGQGPSAHPRAVRDLALIQASQVGALTAVEYLLATGASPAACGSKALTVAVEAGHGLVVAALLAAGADPTARDGAPLEAAARNGRTECVRMLVAAGADPCSRDSWALWLASEAGHMETVAELMAAGADPAFTDDEFDFSALLEDMDCD